MSGTYSKLPITLLDLGMAQFYNYEAIMTKLSESWDVNIEDQISPLNLIKFYDELGYTKSFCILNFNGQPAGLFAITPADATYNSGNDWETIIFIHKDYRRHGIAKAINQSLVEALHRGNQAPVWTYVRQSNKVSVVAHMRSFEQEPELMEDSIGRPYARWHLQSINPSNFLEKNKYVVEDLRHLIVEATSQEIVNLPQPSKF